MNLIQFFYKKKMVGLVSPDGTYINPLESFNSLYSLAIEAIITNQKLKSIVMQKLSKHKYSYDEVLSKGKIMLPINHKNPRYCMVSGTGLTHKNSVFLRKNMHEKTNSADDVLKMYNVGLKEGKPKKGKIGARPEWFFKGDGSRICASGENLLIQDYTLGCGEEAELVAVYLISSSGIPYRIGFTLGNDFSDHILEKKNFFYLAESKLQKCSVGPEIFIGEFPKRVKGYVKIIRDKKVIWKEKFLSGSSNMNYNIKNIEYHFFKNKFFRSPGTLHYLFLGADNISFNNSINIINGDEIEIKSNFLNKALKNKIIKSDEKKFNSVFYL